MSAKVYDAESKQPVPFATVRFSIADRGTIADLDGVFVVNEPDAGIKWVEISCLGYQPLKVTIPFTSNKVYLQRTANGLTEVVIKPPFDKIRRILNAAIANKSSNNPDKYDWYRCKVYYKMLADISLPDSVLNDTGKDAKEMRDILATQHLLMSETYSIRTWKQPQQLQEEVIGSRFSGLKKSLFTGLITDVLPFHAYSDYIQLNGKDYHNPLSKGYDQYYKFDIVDEISQGNDTTWVLSFKPRAKVLNELKGTLYINSDGYAISHFIGSAADTILKRVVRIEQQYEQVMADGAKHWFPSRLNYIIEWTQKTKKSSMTYHLKGNSRIDSVRFKEDDNFRFDKRHTVKMMDDADQLQDTVWKAMRPEVLDSKEARTYQMVDSFGDAKHFDRFMSYLSRLPEGKVSIGKFDVNLLRIFQSNYYEDYRLGLGLQTNEKVIKWLSVGGWAGYGTRDAHWKYGVFTELYADKAQEFVFKASYTDEINDPGRVHIHPDLDQNYLNAYLLNRVDQIKTYSLGIKKKLGYWSLELTGRQQDIVPKYAYAFEHNGVDYTAFKANELSLSFRYAFAERTAPFFGRYYTLGSKYPIVYGKITAGNLQGVGTDIPYTQIAAAISWQKHLNRIGNERFLVSAGKLFSNDQLPLGKLFAGNGYRYDQNGGLSVYSFGGMLTMYPYDYYTDQFVNVIWRHDFDSKLYKFTVPGSSFSSAPYIALQYNMLYGTLQHRETQKFVAFGVPDNAYHEAGILLNNLVKLKYLNLYYFSFNAGYFYHFTPVTDLNKNGKIVLGFDVQF
ncbi:DUF5686 family protein [Flavipsychrobacter stenotrophus]|nr:DUF5686 family protein [Flavipsychrobacter stenotrophus]